VRHCSPRGTWLEIDLETGRTHQIRLQAASRGHPILGDVLYCASTWFGPRFEDERLRRIALHGRSLMFRHPMTREVVSITAPLPDDWDTLELPIESATA
jgi:23S rRNA pseudouridine1911/1915/1917 synthase